MTPSGTKDPKVEKASLPLTLSEQSANRRLRLAHELAEDVARAHGKEGRLRLAGHCLGELGLSTAGRAVQ